MKPLSITGVNWEVYIAECQAHLGMSPTRGLDKDGFDINKTASYLATLSLDNEPLRNLRSRNRTFHHVFASFCGRVDDYTILEIATYTDLKMITKSVNRKWFVILTGSLINWLDATVTCCDEEMSTDTRLCFNQCMFFLEAAGFKEVWCKYDKFNLKDNTYVLRRKKGV
jgi:hypothetical protein